VSFRDDEYRGQALRIAYLYLPVPGAPLDRRILVEVGETTEKR